MDKENLDLVGGKEASWAGMYAVAKSETFRVRGHQLEFVSVAWLLAFVQESIAIVRLCVGEDGFVFPGV